MELGDRAEEALSTRAAGVTRFRLLAVCALLVGLAFIQDPGLLTADTKFDLVESTGSVPRAGTEPLGSEGRVSVSCRTRPTDTSGRWDRSTSSATCIGLPGWAVQRSWLALVLCVAFVGTAKLSRALGVRSDLACTVAGLAFALSPRMLTTLGPISIEAWPSALAPWVLLPLVLGATRGSPRRAAALSALAVAMVGGVNAAATFAVLPMGVVWLLTRTPGPRRRSLMMWWPLFTLLGTLWWLVPLFLMGAYSPPFLRVHRDHVRSPPSRPTSSTRCAVPRTGCPTSSAASRAGNDLLVQGFLPFASGVVLLVGFAGLLDRRNPHRLFLALSLLVGVLMVTAGHMGPVTGWFSGDCARLLDGSLAPLRNVHKFDPILRLPLVLGLALVLDRVRRASSDPQPSRPPGGRACGRFEPAGSWSAMAMIAVAAAAATRPSPTRIAPADPVLAVPGYWQQTARWLDAHEGDGASLAGAWIGLRRLRLGLARGRAAAVPRSTASWTVRNQIPLTPPGNIRMLDRDREAVRPGSGIDGLDRLSAPGRAALPRRAQRPAPRPTTSPTRCSSTRRSTDSPGIVRVQTFGPQVGGGAHLTEGRRAHGDQRRMAGLAPGRRDL